MDFPPCKYIKNASDVVACSRQIVPKHGFCHSLTPSLSRQACQKAGRQRMLVHLAVRMSSMTVWVLGCRRDASHRLLALAGCGYRRLFASSNSRLSASDGAHLGRQSARFPRWRKAIHATVHPPCWVRREVEEYGGSSQCHPCSPMSLG